MRDTSISPSSSPGSACPAYPVDMHAAIDQLEAAMLAGADAGILTLIEMPVIHLFVPGVYAREIFMPAGTRLTSQIHQTEHFYVVLSGVVDVLIPEVGIQRLTAGHVGITKPGTRRVLHIIEDCRWITFHTTTTAEESVESVEERVETIGRRILERRELAEGKTAGELYRAQLRQCQVGDERAVDDDEAGDDVSLVTEDLL